METREADVIVVGAGPVGENVAARVVRGGLSALIVERELVGGECSYWACIPSKTLLRPGEAVHAARHAAASAWVDVESALAWRDFMVSDYSDASQERWLEKAGIDLLRGGGRLAGPGVVDIDGVRHTAGHVVVATGTPTGIFHIFRQVDGASNGPLGQLWRPKFFTGGYAIHGAASVPSYPASHGCARLSNEAINWIWANNLAPIGTEVWVY